MTLKYSRVRYLYAVDGASSARRRAGRWPGSLRHLSVIWNSAPVSSFYITPIPQFPIKTLSDARPLFQDRWCHPHSGGIPSMLISKVTANHLRLPLSKMPSHGGHRRAAAFQTAPSHTIEFDHCVT